MALGVQEDKHSGGGMGWAGRNDWGRINYSYTEKQSGNEHTAFSSE